MSVKLKNARCSHAKLIRSFASQIYFFLSTAPSRIKRCMKMPVVSLKLTAFYTKNKSVQPWQANPYWTALLDSLTGQPYWTAFLDRLIGQTYWTALLDSLIEQPFWQQFHKRGLHIVHKFQLTHAFCIMWVFPGTKMCVTRGIGVLESPKSF